VAGWVPPSIGHASEIGRHRGPDPGPEDPYEHITGGGFGGLWLGTLVRLAKGLFPADETFERGRVICFVALNSCAARSNLACGPLSLRLLHNASGEIVPRCARCTINAGWPYHGAWNQLVTRAMTVVTLKRSLSLKRSL
jgi:hypothetical protein